MNNKNSIEDERNNLSYYLERNCKVNCKIDQSTNLDKNIVISSDSCGVNQSSRANCINNCDIKLILKSIAQSKKLENDKKSMDYIKKYINKKCNLKKKNVNKYDYISIPKSKNDCNVISMEALKNPKTNCYITHGIDLLPVNIEAKILEEELILKERQTIIIVVISTISLITIIIISIIIYMVYKKKN